MASAAVVGNNAGEESSQTFLEVDRKEGFGGIVKEVDLKSRKEYHDLEEYVHDLSDYLKTVIEPIIKDKGAINFWLSIEVTYTHPTKEIKVDRSIYLHTGKLVILRRSQLDEKVEQAMQVILQRNYGFIRGKSGLIIDTIRNARFKIVDYLPLAMITTSTKDPRETDHDSDS